MHDKTDNVRPESERAARIEIWASYLCAPQRYIRECLRDVVIKASGIDQEGKMHEKKYYLESDIEKNVPEYSQVKELESIGKTREQIRKEILKSALSKKGYNDKRSLENVASAKFAAETFPPYGKGVKFYRYVTDNLTERKAMRMTKVHLEEIGRLLELPEFSDERRNEMLLLLREAGYPDQRSLQMEDVRVILEKDYGKYGKGRNFFQWFTGTTLVINKDSMINLSQRLGLPELCEERKQEMRKLMKEAGYPDLRTIEMITAHDFSSRDFGKYGKGNRFYRWVTGKMVGNETRKERVLEVARILDMLSLSSDTVASLRQEISHAGYPDRRALEMDDQHAFLDKTYGVFGKGKNFYLWVTGTGVGKFLNKNDIVGIAGKLELPEVSDIRKAEMRTIFEAAGYSDIRSIDRGEAVDAKNKDFGIYGKITKFYHWVTGKKSGGILNKKVLVEIAEKLELPALSEKRKYEMKQLLANAGYPDMRSLEMENPSVFARKEFGQYGKGKKFYMWVTGDELAEGEAVSKKFVLRIGEILQLPSLSLERKEEMKRLLAAAGFTDRRSLEFEQMEEFNKREFGRYGLGRKFCSWVLGLGARRVGKSKTDILKICDVLQLPVLSSEGLHQMMEALRLAGYENLEDVFKEDPRVFSQKSFGTYGRGRTFARWVTGETVKSGEFHNLKKEHLHDIVNTLRQNLANSPHPTSTTYPAISPEFNKPDSSS